MKDLRHQITKIYSLKYLSLCSSSFFNNRMYPNTFQHTFTRGFNCSVNIPESWDFRSQFDPLDITVQSFFLNTFLSAYAFWMKMYEINKSVKLMIIELKTKTRLISETECCSLWLVRSGYISKYSEVIFVKGEVGRVSSSYSIHQHHFIRLDEKTLFKETVSWPKRFQKNV